jgi:hypothetical protein
MDNERNEVSATYSIAEETMRGENMPDQWLNTPTPARDASPNAGEAFRPNGWERVVENTLNRKGEK